MMDFRIVPHRVISSKNMIEVLLDGVVVATIATTGLDSIHVMSAYFDRHWFAQVASAAAYPSAAAHRTASSN